MVDASLFRAGLSHCQGIVIAVVIAVSFLNFGRPIGPITDLDLDLAVGAGVRLTNPVNPMTLVTL